MITENKHIVCAVVDDEPLARDLLENYIGKIEGLELAGKCRNVIEASELLKKKKIDLLFLDIKMPGVSGVEFVRLVKDLPAFVFTTAYEYYAVEGFELDAIDYLVKPFTFERFKKSVDRFKGRIKDTANSESLSDDFEKTFVYLKSSGKMVKVFFKDIIYIESLRNNVKIVTRDREIVTHKKISELEENLPGERFIRIHRSFIVSISKIDSYTHSEVEAGSHFIPIGRNYREKVIEELGKRGIQV